MRGIEANNGPAPEANVQPVPIYSRSLSLREYMRARDSRYLRDSESMLDIYDERYDPVRETLDRDRYEAALRLRNLSENTFERLMRDFEYAYRNSPQMFSRIVHKIGFQALFKD